MTVYENRNPRVQYNGPIEINDELAIPFPYAEKEDVACQLNEELLRYSVDYTILGQTLTIKVPAGQSDSVTIYRTTPLDQQAEFPQNNRFNSAKLNESLDKICMQQQEQSEMINRCTKVPITFMNFDGAIPYPQANKALKINSEATGFTLSNYDPDEAIVVTEQYKSEAVAARDESIRQQQEATNQANLAKEWATSETMVQSIDYSSKYYAKKSKESSDIASEKTEEVVASGNTALTDINSAKSAALTAVSDQQQASVSAVNTAGNTQIALATEQANIATQQATIATNKANEVVASGNEALSNITTAKDNAITSITNEGATQIGLVKQEGAARIEEILETGCIDVEYTEETSTLSFTGGGSVLLSNYYTKEETNELIPTNNNQLINGAGYITANHHDNTKQDVISDLATIRSGARLGATALQSYTETDPIYTADKPNIATKDELTEGLSTKQDVITDLNTIRQGAKLGATALQSYTETDPIYTADKPNIALKSEIPTKVSSLTNDANYQTTTNLVTSVSSSSTNSQYPSAKCVYDIIGNIESLLAKV